MSTAPVLTQSPEAVLPKEIPEVTDAYRKAHKSYVIVAGLLASWELIGITLNTKEKWGVELKSPAAVPLILFTLVFYSGYKMTIEWLQCDAERRKHFAAKLDYSVAHSIGVVAVGISVVQYLWRVRVADVISGGAFRHSISLAVAMWVAYICFRLLLSKYWRENAKPKDQRSFLLAVAGIVICVVAMSVLIYRESHMGFVLGLGGAFILVLPVEIGVYAGKVLLPWSEATDD